jgi:hypothetical protein
MICVNQPGHLPEANPYAVEDLSQARACAREEIARTVEAFDGPGESNLANEEAVALTRADRLTDEGGVIPIGRYVVDVQPLSPDEYERWLSEEDFE